MLNHTYADMLRHHPYGYALYEPESSLIVKPGALGYINNEGRWTPLVGHDGKIIDLSVPRMLVKNGLTAFKKLHAAVREDLIWGPKVSDKMKGIKVNFKENRSLIPAGIPADISALYKFKTDSSFGAILMTANPVTHEVINDTKACTAWFKENMAAILRHWPAVINHGLVIVTSIHKTAQADIKCWQDKRKEISVGFKFSAVEKGEVAPSSKWYKVSGDGWVTSKAPQVAGTQGRILWRTALDLQKATEDYLEPARSRASLDTTRTHRESNSIQSSYQAFYNGFEYSTFYEAIGNLSLETVDYDGDGGDDVNNSDDDAIGSDGADDVNNSDDDAWSDDAGSDDAGSDDAASDDAGSDNAGSDDAGSDDAGSDAGETDDAASDNAGSDDAGSDDAASDDAASDDAASDDAASDDAADAGSDGGGDADDGYGDD